MGCVDCVCGLCWTVWVAFVWTVLNPVALYGLCWIVCMWTACVQTVGPCVWTVFECVDCVCEDWIAYVDYMCVDCVGQYGLHLCVLYVGMCRLCLCGPPLYEMC